MSRRMTLKEWTIIRIRNKRYDWSEWRKRNKRWKQDKKEERDGKLKERIMKVEWNKKREELLRGWINSRRWSWWNLGYIRVNECPFFMDGYGNRNCAEVCHVLFPRTGKINACPTTCDCPQRAYSKAHVLRAAKMLLEYRKPRIEAKHGIVPKESKEYEG